MLELARSQSTPALVAAAEPVIRTPVNGTAVAQADVSAVPGKPREVALGDGTNAKNLGNEALGATVAGYVPPPSPPPPPPAVPILPPPAVPTPPPAPPPTPAPPPIVSEPELPPVVVPPQINQLAWVRYSWINRPDSDTFSRSLEQALTAGLDKVASNSGYALYRTPSSVTDAGASLSSQTSAEPVVNFRLAEATAHLWRGAFIPAENVNVHKGALTVDFSRSTFATRLDVSNPRIGAENISASGAVLPSGVLRADVSNAAITGGLSTDGKEAGYAFEKTLNNGVLRGITLWGR